MFAPTEKQLYRAQPRVMVAEQLGDWMAWHGLTAAMVAEACKVDRRTVYRWRRAQSRIPRTVWPSLAQQFGDPIPWFIVPQAFDPRGNRWAVTNDGRTFDRVADDQ